MSSVSPPDAEWLEADGLGGFASGTVSGARTRRYHALLLAATTPPTGRMVLVNGIEVFADTAAGEFALSSQRYVPDVTHPDGASRIAGFEPEPWPAWVFELADGTRIRQEIFVPHECAAVALRWSRTHGEGPLRLRVRPLFSGRDYHSLHHENEAFRFAPVRHAHGQTWQPYDGIPPVHVLHDGHYEHGPQWYRNFQYDDERARGLDWTEDLAAPGTFHFDLSEGPAVLLLAAGAADDDLVAAGENVRTAGERLAQAERSRRPTDPLLRARDAYFVRRGQGRTLIAGYPWFTDWGRDTFIALRGLAIAGGRLDDAGSILTEWADHVSEGMLPNLFPDGGVVPEYNSVDASLWYVIAAGDYLDAVANAGQAIAAPERDRLVAAIDAILSGYAAGTRFGIRADADGLLACGAPGVQLTWMDAKVGDWVVTPRTGKPVEIQALWLNALAIGARFAPAWRERFERGSASFAARFWNEAAGCLYDVVDVDHEPGRVDAAIRPNQILAVGGLPLAIVDAGRARRIVAVVEERLATPLGLRSLAPGEIGYAPRYQGGVRERDGVYHQGTVWPWLFGAFVDAWIRVHGNGAARKKEAAGRFLAPLRDHLATAGIGHVSEIADAERPHTPRGCPFQAWSLGELIRIERMLDGAAVKSRATRAATKAAKPAARARI